MSNEIVPEAEVRIVRCPKCGKLLPEITNIPVYQCGGCHTVLQAKNRGRSRSSSVISEANSTHLQSEIPKDNQGEGSKPSESSCVEAETENIQQGKKDEVQSHQESQQKRATQASSSDDSGQISNGGRSCEKSDERSRRPSADECFRDENEEIVIAQSSNELPVCDTRHRSRPQIVGPSNVQNPVYDHSHSGSSREARENAEERSNGSSGRFYYSPMNKLENSTGSSSSGELLNRPPRPRQGISLSTRSEMLSKPISNPLPPKSFSNRLHRLENGGRGFVKSSWDSRHHTPPVDFHGEANWEETRSNGAAFRGGLYGPSPINGNFLGRQVDGFSTDNDYSNEMESEVDHSLEPGRLNSFESHSPTKNRTYSSLMNETKFNHLDPLSRRSERNMDWQHSPRKLQSQVRERKLQSSPGPKKMDYLNSIYSVQPPQHGQQSQGIRGRRPYLSKSPTLESDRSDFYMYSEGLPQFGQDHGNGEFDPLGNIPRVDETKIQILQERMELLQKLDELRNQLSRSCQLPYPSTLPSQQKIGRAVMTPKMRPVMVGRVPRRKGHVDTFVPHAHDAESLSWDDYSDGSDQSSGQLAYAARMQCMPGEEHRQIHHEHESLPGMMDEEDRANGFASKHVNPHDFRHRMSRGLYADERAIPSHRIPRASFSGELQDLKQQRRAYGASCQSVNAEHNSCSCSGQLLQHRASCYSHPYQDEHSLHIPLHVLSNVCCHQQGHTATNHIYFHNSYPAHNRVQATSSYHHPCPYHEELEIQRSKVEESGLVPYQEKKNAQQPLAGKRRTLPCSPFAGAAPFVLCDNCLQLLLLPTNLSPALKKKYKLQCGTCSSIFEFSLHSKRNCITMAKHTGYPSRCIQENPCESQEIEILADNHLTSTSSTIENMPTQERNVHATRSHSDDYDVGFSKSYSANGKKDFLPLAPTVQNSVLKSQPILNKPHLPIAGVDERLQDSSLQRAKEKGSDTFPKDLHDMRSCEARDNSNQAEEFFVPDIASPMAGSPLHELFGYSSPLEMINKCIAEKTTGVSHKRSVDSKKSGYSENDLNSNYSKTANGPPVSFSLPDINSRFGTSKDITEREHSEDLSRESGRSWNTSIKGFLKKGIKDLRKGNHGLEPVRTNVFVNGRSIPDNLVKKAEEYAGNIQPGNYWYDYQAGFWGIMGEPCLGIIPPFIDEFNYPMPRDCAGGKTRILVNGRELHQKDLDLLSGRGLPTTKDKSYRIEISGRVVDKSTDTELKSLGKLAPTLEKVGRGSGMRAPRKRS